MESRLSSLRVTDSEVITPAISCRRLKSLLSRGGVVLVEEVVVGEACEVDFAGFFVDDLLELVDVESRIDIVDIFAAYVCSDVC